MGRLNKAVQRAHQSGLAPAFGSFPDDADLKKLVSDLTDESRRRLLPSLSSLPLPVAPIRVAPTPVPMTAAPMAVAAKAMPAPSPAPKPTPVAAKAEADDREIKEIFFDTYFEKVWAGPR